VKRDPILKLDQVGHQFGQLQVLRDLNLTIHAGERVALIGPSGAGKTTLLHVLNGSLIPSSGQVTILGSDLSSLKPRQRRRIQRQIGMIYQQHHLVLNLAVIHNVNAGQLGRWSLARAAWSLLWPQEVETAAQALEQVGILEKIYTRTDQLSGGQQQRVALARILVQDPVVILADEPVSSLDPARSHSLMRLLRDLTLSTGKTLVVSLHEIEFAFQYCTRILGLRQGTVVFDAPTAAVTQPMIADLYHLNL
jgi:phosphonate transport system ATP-binding protein